MVSKTLSCLKWQFVNQIVTILLQTQDLLRVFVFMSLSAEPLQNVNVADVIKGIWRRKLMVILLALIGCALGSGIVFLLKPSYQAEAQIIIENTATSFERASTDIQGTQSQVADERYISSQVAVIKSSDLLARVSDQLALDKNQEFNVALAKIGTLKSVLIATGFADDPRLFSARENALKAMSSKLTISGIQDSNIVSITSRMNDKEAAANVANALAESYVASTRESDSDSTDRARLWLGSQIAELRQKVSDSENASEKYRAEAGLLKGQTATLGTQQISELNTQITVAENAAGEASARAAEIKSMMASGAVEASSDVLNSALIQNLREQQSAATRKLSELSGTYLPNHPKMISAQRELSSINTSIKREASKVVESLQGQAKIANQRAEALRSNLEKLKGRESSANISDVKLKSLERDALANRTLLESMLVRYADASARQDPKMQPSKARIIQRASVPPVPYFPKTGPTIFLTTMAGLGLGLGLAFIMEVMSAAANIAGGQGPVARAHVASAQREQGAAVPTVIVPDLMFPQSLTTKPAAKTPEPFTSPVSAMIATGSRMAAVDMLNDQQSAQHNASAAAMANACQTLRENKSCKNFSFTSLGSEGPDAAVAALSTARILAEGKKRVAIVDLSQHGGDLEMLAGLPAGTGLTDLVAGTADFTKIIIRDPQSTIHIIRKGLSRDSENDHRLAEKFDSVLTALDTIYDYVFVLVGDAYAAAPGLVKNCPAAFILATATRQRDAIIAAQILQTNGVLAPMFIQVNSNPLADNLKTASA
jgi:polysaccharide biosynthesis transport protein